jgi:hypothetical protein
MKTSVKVFNGNNWTQATKQDMRDITSLTPQNIRIVATTTGEVLIYERSNPRSFDMIGGQGDYFKRFEKR